MSPESAPRTEPQAPALAEVPTQPAAQPELITVPDWNQAPAEAAPIPTFEAPATPVVEQTPVETPVEAATPDAAVEDVKLKKITVIDAQGTGDTKVVEFGRFGGLQGTETTRVVEVQPARGRGFSKLMHKFFGPRPKTPESK